MRSHPAATIGVLVFVVLVVCPVKTNFDSRWTLPTAISLLREGNADLDEYGATLDEGPEAVMPINGHRFSAFPLGPALCAVPPLALLQLVLAVSSPVTRALPRLDAQVRRWQSHFDQTGRIDPDFFDTTQLLLASAIVALTAAVFWRLARARLSATGATVAGLLFAFCTPAWSVASRALWQHGPSMLCLVLALAGLMRAEDRSEPPTLAALPLALSFVMRPTNAVAVAVLGVYAVARFRRRAIGFVLVGLAVGVTFLAMNRAAYGVWLPPYFLPSRIGGERAVFWEALAGNLISPARGLLVFSPVFWLLPVSLWLARRDRVLTPLELCVALIVVLHLVLVSGFPHWWAGHSYGPRFMTDMAPFCVVLLFPLIARAAREPRLRGALAGLAVISFLIHLRGATSWAAWEWNGTPVSVDLCPQRVWSWSDPQFLRFSREGHDTAVSCPEQ